jgi:choline-glycine betaine transporter
MANKPISAVILTQGLLPRKIGYSRFRRHRRLPKSGLPSPQSHRFHRDELGQLQIDNFDVCARVFSVKTTFDFADLEVQHGFERIFHTSATDHDVLIP